MPLNLTGTDTQQYSAAAAAQFGAGTLLVVTKKASDTGAIAWACGSANSGGTGQFALGVSATNVATSHNGTGTSTAGTLTVTAADGWVAFAASKTLGTTTPRYHKYVYSTGVASHNDGTATRADSGTIGAGGKMAVAGYGTATNTWPGSFAVMAVYDRALSDQEFESAAVSLDVMRSLGPNWGFWLLDGATTGANEAFIGSTLLAGAATSVDGGGSPVGGLGGGQLASLVPFPPANFTAAWVSTGNQCVQLSASGIIPTATSVWVERFDTATLTNGEEVRGSRMAAPVSGSFTIYDREFTPNVLNTYKLHQVSP